MKLVSIIVPIYNTASFLPKCIESLRNQSYKNVEIILVNDGSSDNSESICKEYLECDIRIRYILKSNDGLSSARNAGLDIAVGEYISFIDSDDWIAPEFISTLLKACLDNNAVISMCGRVVVSEQDEKSMFALSNIQLWSSKEGIERLLTWDNIDASVCDKLFHRSLFDNQRFPLGRISEDLPVLTSVLLKTSSIVHVGKPMYYYLQRLESITKSKFTVNKMTVIQSAEEVRIMVGKKYPELKSKADYYYYYHLFYLLDLVFSESSNLYKEERSELVNMLKKCVLNVIINDNVTKNKKIKALLIFLNLYIPVKNIFDLKKR